MVLIEQLSNGTWFIKVGQFIPDLEKWLCQENGLARLDKALSWAAKNKPQDNFAEVAEKIKNS